MESHAAKHARNSRIYHECTNGALQVDVARKWGITKQRVNQIVRRYEFLNRQQERMAKRQLIENMYAFPPKIVIHWFVAHGDIFDHSARTEHSPA